MRKEEALAVLGAGWAHVVKAGIRLNFGAKSPHNLGKGTKVGKGHATGDEG